MNIKSLVKLKVGKQSYILNEIFIYNIEIFYQKIIFMIAIK